MPLPRQVQAQLDHAEALLAQANAPAVQPAPEPTQEVPPVAQPAPVAVAPVAPPTPAPASPDDDPALWKQRYLSLQGVHRTLQQSHQQALSQLNDLSTRMQALEQTARPATPDPEPARPTAATPQDVQTFGEPMVEMVQRVVGTFLDHARQQLTQELSNLRNEVNALKGNVQSTVATVVKTAEDLFFDKLAEQVPNWVAINDSFEWQQWLAQVDPIFRVPRQQALEAAHKNGDHEGAANMFKTFLQTLPPVAQAPAAPPSSPTPRAAASAAPPAGQPALQMVSAGEVAQFYDDVRRGKWKGNEPARAAKEAEYNLALAQGRVV